LKCWGQYDFFFSVGPFSHENCIVEGVISEFPLKA